VSYHRTPHFLLYQNHAEYDRLTDAEKAERKPRMACEIDEHLAILKAN